MSHRTQVTLTHKQYARLREESRRSGHGIAELIRRAVERSYGTSPTAEVSSALDASFGSWDDRDFDGASYVDGLRRGTSRRLTDLAELVAGMGPENAHPETDWGAPQGDEVR